MTFITSTESQRRVKAHPHSPVAHVPTKPGSSGIAIGFGSLMWFIFARTKAGPANARCDGSKLSRGVDIVQTSTFRRLHDSFLEQ